jgi:hypothetical protein
MQPHSVTSLKTIIAISLLSKPQHLHNEFSVNLKGRDAMSVHSECVDNTGVLVSP